MPVTSYRDLIAWQKSIDLVEMVYQATEGFPRREVFGLANQLRRAVVSIPSNIAEGQGRGSTRDFLHYLSIARGSLQEVETQILIAGRLRFLDKEAVGNLIAISTEIARIINGLRAKLSHP